MSEFDKPKKTKIKKNSNFYLWVFAMIMLFIMGAMTLLSGRFQYRSYVKPFEGSLAYLFGGILICCSSYFLYYLFFKAEKNEKKRVGFHSLDNFSHVIDGHKISFNIEPGLLSTGGTFIDVFSYVLRIEFDEKISACIDISRRDRFEYLLWKIGLTRFKDISTGNYYFDSMYKVSADNKLLLKKILSQKVIKLLEEFDMNYPPIRNRNGILKINNESIVYNEGPYREEGKIFDPHRGIIEDLAAQLLNIVKALKGN